MKDSRDSAMIQFFQQVQRFIETVIGQLSERFHLERVRARDMWHLTSRLNRKLLAHTVCFGSIAIVIPILNDVHYIDPYRVCISGI